MPDLEAGADGHTHERNCLNCGAQLGGDYCHACGQKAHVHRTLMAWWHDFLHGVVHLDGRFWHTLPMLAWRPGQLTRRYIDGERAKFVSPMAIFLFSVLLMFAVFSAVGPDLDLSESVEEAIQEEREKLSDLQSERASASGGEAAELDAKIKETRDDIVRLNELRSRGVATVPVAGSEPVEGDWLFKAAIAKARENPDLLLYKMQANAYKFSWALIPLSVPLVWLLFLHRRRYRQSFSGYDHLVFVTYSIAFMSLGLVAWVLLRVAGLMGSLLGVIFTLIPVAHMYRQLRGAYGLSRWSAAWRTLALLMFANMALGLFTVLLLLLGALG